MSTVNNGPQIVRTGLILDLDASYMRSYSPNVYTNPTDILARQYMANEIQSCTVSKDPSQSRQYGSIPMKMAITGNDAYAGTYGYTAANLASALSGQTWTISVWAKASIATDGQLFIFGADTNGAVFTINDYSAGTIAITTSWQRFSFSYTFTNASTRYIQFRLDGTNTGGSGQTIWWDGLQVERASAATTFNPYYFGNTVWKDVSNNLNNGTLTSGPTFNTSNKGNILFDGTNDNIQLGTSSAFLPTSGITINCWAKTNVTGVYKKLFVTVTSGTQSVTGIYFSLGPSPSNIYLGIITNNGDQSATSTTNPSTSLFSNFCGTYDGSNIKLYLNGVLLATKAQTGAIVNTGIGRISGYDNGSEIWDGNISTFSIYNRALTATEVVQNYEATKSKFGL